MYYPTEAAATTPSPPPRGHGTPPAQAGRGGSDRGGGSGGGSSSASGGRYSSPHSTSPTPPTNRPRRPAVLLGRPVAARATCGQEQFDIARTWTNRFAFACSSSRTSSYRSFANKKKETEKPMEATSTHKQENNIKIAHVCPLVSPPATAARVPTCKKQSLSRQPDGGAVPGRPSPQR